MGVQIVDYVAAGVMTDDFEVVKKFNKFDVADEWFDNTHKEQITGGKDGFHVIVDCDGIFLFVGKILQKSIHRTLEAEGYSQSDIEDGYSRLMPYLMEWDAKLGSNLADQKPKLYVFSHWS